MDEKTKRRVSHIYNSLQPNHSSDLFLKYTNSKHTDSKPTNINHKPIKETKLFPTEQEVIQTAKELENINDSQLVKDTFKVNGDEYPTLVPIRCLSNEVRQQIWNRLKSNGVDISSWKDAFTDTKVD